MIYRELTQRKYGTVRIHTNIFDTYWGTLGVIGKTFTSVAIIGGIKQAFEKQDQRKSPISIYSTTQSQSSSSYTTCAAGSSSSIAKDSLSDPKSGTLTQRRVGGLQVSFNSPETDRGL